MNENVFIEQICTYLADNSGRFAFGDGSTNLKIGEIISGENGVFAIASPSVDPDMYTAIEYHNIDFWATHKSSSEAMLDMRAIYGLFHQTHHYDLTSFRVFFSHVLGQIVDLDRDGESRKVLRISVRYIIMNLIS